MAQHADLLSRVNHPHDLRALSLAELTQLANEIRQRIMEVVNVNGGHLASNLGSVEFTLALHRVFDFSKDRLVWDVSHQTYPHKLVTGRRDRFHEIRRYKGICGFCNKKESIFDLFDAGHAGTAVSLALGVAAADHLAERDRKAVAVVGDAAIAAGMAFEALNHAGELRRNLLVVLNDNRMSIDKSVGALSKQLNRIRAKPLYKDLKKDVHQLLGRFGAVGRRVEEGIENIHGSLKHSVVPGLLFQEFGFNYYGPVDGHDLSELLRIFEDLKSANEPVLLHLHTVKGQGYDPASDNPIKYHASKNFLPATAAGDGADASPVAAPASDASRVKAEGGDDAAAKRSAPAAASVSTPPTYTQVFTEAICDAARRDGRVAAITAAMSGGTGLAPFAREFPDRFFDVGIAEQHGGAFASGLAAGGLRPVFAVYSTFSQRAYDQFVHDTCIQENSVIYCLDRAGLAGEDGWTHHGAFDIAFLRTVPNVILMAPRDGPELVQMFRFALDQSTRPVAIRWPKGQVPSLPAAREPVIRLGRAEIIKEGEDIAFFAYGSMVEQAYRAAEMLEADGVAVTVVNARFAKPLDVEMLRTLSKRHATLVAVEEHSAMGGFSGAVVEAIADHGIPFQRVLRRGIPDTFQSFGARELLLRDCGLDANSLYAWIAEWLEDANAAVCDVGPSVVRSK